MFPLEPLAAANQAIRMLRRGKANDLPINDDAIGDMVREAVLEGLPDWVTKNKGYIYLAANPAWPGLHKIGCTRRGVEQRMRALSGEGVPTPWHCLHSWEVYDAHGLEAQVHQACAAFRVRGEIFNAPATHLRAVVEACIQDDFLKLTTGLEPIAGPLPQEASQLKALAFKAQ